MVRKLFILGVLVLGVVPAARAQQAPSSTPVRGFTTSSSETTALPGSNQVTVPTAADLVPTPSPAGQESTGQVPLPDLVVGQEQGTEKVPLPTLPTPVEPKTDQVAIPDLPVATPNAAQAAPAGNNCNGSCDGCHCRRHEGKGLQRVWNWLTYHPLPSSCACGGCFPECEPCCTPHLYEFFLRDCCGGNGGCAASYSAHSNNCCNH
jgi:hypothetical protein